MKLLILIIPFLLTVYLGSILYPYIILISFKKRLFDPVDSRKFHQYIIPRLGGVAFAPLQCTVFALTTVIVYKVNFVPLQLNTVEIFPMFLALLCGLIILFLVGLADDLIGVAYKWKFIAQILVACLFPLSGLWINDLNGLLSINQLPGWVGMPLTVFITVLIINAINLIDGVDGLCAGLVTFGCLFLGALFVNAQAWLHALFAFVTIGVLLPFFYYNVFGTKKRKRRIFMGDTGSMTLGLSIAFLAISFGMDNIKIKPFTEGSLIVALSTLILPIFDVGRVMLVRWYSKLPVFQADRNHLHHKFLSTGMSHQATTFTMLSLALAISIFNVISIRYMNNNLVVLCDVVFWISFIAVWNVVENRRRSRIEELKILNKAKL